MQIAEALAEGKVLERNVKVLGPWNTIRKRGDSIWSMDLVHPSTAAYDNIAAAVLELWTPSPLRVYRQPQLASPLRQRPLQQAARAHLEESGPLLLAL